MTSLYTQSTVQKSYSISQAKLKKMVEQNDRLKEQLTVSRIPVSEASSSLIEYCQSTKDPLLPSIWGSTNKQRDPFVATGASKSNNSCCIIV